MAERRVKHAWVRYRTLLGAPAEAWRGSVIDLPPGEVIRLEAAGAVGPVGEDYGTPKAPVMVAAVDMSGTEPGQELGYAEIEASATTTNTVGGNTAAAAKFGGLIVSDIPGVGRPVDIEVYAMTAYHSVANTAGAIYIVTTDDLGTVEAEPAVCQFRTHSTANNGAAPVALKRRRILDAGRSYTFEVAGSGNAAGTTTLFAFPTAVASLIVTQR